MNLIAIGIVVVLVFILIMARLFQQENQINELRNSLDSSSATIGYLIEDLTKTGVIRVWPEGGGFHPGFDAAEFYALTKHLNVRITRNLSTPAKFIAAKIKGHE